MDPIDFVLELQDQNPDSVAQIQREILETHYFRRNFFIVLRDHNTRQIGYLLHGPMHPDEPFKLDAICIANSDRQLRHGANLFQKLLARARVHRATELRLACPGDLPANQFFEHMGMLKITQTREASGRKRLFTIWRLTIQPNPTPQNPLKTQLATETANHTHWPNGR